MSNPIHRTIAMLRLIPAAPYKISVVALHERLAAEGYETTIRTLQRDLVSLQESEAFAIESDEAKPAGWSWRANARGLSAPAMTDTEALALDLLDKHMAPLMPGAASGPFQQLTANARAQLGNSKALPLARWRRRVAVVGESLPLLPPRRDPELEDIVYLSLLEERRFEADYTAASGKGVRRYLFNPVALVLQGPVSYLLATLDAYEDIRHFPLHRMSNAKRRFEPAAPPPGFDLDTHLHRNVAFSIAHGSEIQLRLRTGPWLTRHLGERALSADQTIRPETGSDWFRITATLPMSEQLIWWIRSHGMEIEVLAPLRLRNQLRKDALEVAALYGKGHSPASKRLAQ